MEHDVPVCPRCAGKHDKLKFKPMKQPFGRCNVWASCPSTKEPILGMIELTLEAVDLPKPSDRNAGDGDSGK